MTTMIGEGYTEYRRVNAIGSNGSLSVVIPKYMCRHLDIRKGNYIKFILLDESKQQLRMEKFQK